MDKNDKIEIDDRLLAFYNSIVQNAINLGELKEALGISLETMRIDSVYYKSIFYSYKNYYR